MTALQNERENDRIFTNSHFPNFSSDSRFVQRPEVKAKNREKKTQLSRSNYSRWERYIKSLFHVDTVVVIVVVVVVVIVVVVANDSCPFDHAHDLV